MKRSAAALILLLPLSIPISGEYQGKIDNPPIYIAFHWHMHQPIYYPYESVVQTEQNGRYPYSVFDIFNERTGPYTSYPPGAVQKGKNSGFEYFGAQVSLSGSLIENLNELEDYGNVNFQGWKNHWTGILSDTTSLGNPRLDLVAFGYFHPLMGLIWKDDIREQIQMHRSVLQDNFGITDYSKGIFPPENAFAPGMIPELTSEGIEWVLVDNIHFERACEGYPFTTAGNLYEPNKSDIRNPDPGDWVQLTDLWAPTMVSARWAHQPHYVEYTDPGSGQVSRIIAVPADRYMGIEDGRGGFGALQYETVMSQLESYNTDPDHPILIVLAHDGDNHGGGSSAYYNNNFQDFVDWLADNPDRFVCTTIQDYLDRFPPGQDDVIHIENGSWSGADNGDPEFRKWLADENAGGYSADRNSWGIITAARNYIATAADIAPEAQNTMDARSYLLVGQSSDYWYWDYSLDGIWDSHPSRASNQAVQLAGPVISGNPDNTGPTIFLPQREPYNPGGSEWNQPQPSDFQVWTYVYDISGLSSVRLKYRIDNDGEVSGENMIYNGGRGVGSWYETDMQSSFIPSQTDPLPDVKAEEYSADIAGHDNVLIDYYVSAVDSNGNSSRTVIQHVWVGENQGGGTGVVSWLPVNPAVDDSITITVPDTSRSALLHWGVNYQGSSWQTPAQVYWPDGTGLFQGSGPAVESPFHDEGSVQNITIGPFNRPEQAVSGIAFVIHYEDGSWDNNNGNDYHIDFGGSGGSPVWLMDGNLESGADIICQSGGMTLYAIWQSPFLYLASETAVGSGGDKFILICGDTLSMTPAPWAKSGQTVQWDAFLANEADNNYIGWFDDAGGGGQGSGDYMEGWIDIGLEFGSIPPTLYLSLARYQTQDGGSLILQVPPGDGDGNIEGLEYIEYQYTIPVSVEGNEGQTPRTFTLSQNYPNPFNP
ncbi:MAG: hypothetical protein GF417_06730, partial [Candidatus Latescibacteria bacterium]|nr:hypothetical protein [bacterium]MBD3424113.1 hypothetical protein [Candidatus Latescibacterota bacterium]